MCKHQIIGDFYRGCGVCLFFFCSAFTDATPHKLLKMPLLTVLPLQHFHGRYFTGETSDCGSDSCKTSRAHKHKANNCGCAEIVVEDRRVQNMFQIPFPECQRTTR
ncbi:hypothetical protein BJ165DRAFT_1531050 [Panaeolus papilionaceus]|nr:hypothetical protein BJ165DRAFT_1531050 [Panaeolus papilionaceus]